MQFFWDFVDKAKNSHFLVKFEHIGIKQKGG